MALIDAATRQEFERLTESAMPDTFVPDVVGEWVPDGGGGGYTTTTPGAAYPCRKPASAEEIERLIGGQLQVAGQAVLLLPLGSPVGTDAVGTYTNSRTGEAIRYAVTGTRTGSYSPHLVLIVAPAGTQEGS